MHQFAEHRVGAGLREQQGRLTATERLFVGGEEMVEVGEVSIELEGLRIPYPQEEQLKGDAKEHREPTGYQTIDHPESQHHHHKTEALPDQRTDIVDLRRHKECQQQCQHQIPQDDPLDGEQTLAGLLLDFKYLKTFHFLEPFVVLIPFDGSFHALLQLHLGLKTQFLAGRGDIAAPVALFQDIVFIIV